MDIRCPSCSKLFRVADEKISGKGIRFKCSKCAEVITITKDDFEMNLLAREGDATEVPPRPAAQPAPPPKPRPAPVPPAPPIPGPEPEAREYKPQEYTPPVDLSAEDQQIPSVALNDFDFSEPHAAAAAAAQPEEGFGGGGGGGAGFSFDDGPEQQAAPEIEISPEAAAEAEAALQFPDDLVSEPKRKPVFGAGPPDEQEPAVELGQIPEPDLKLELASEPEPELKPKAVPPREEPPKTGPVFTPPPRQKPAPKLQQNTDDEMDLGAALRIPQSVGPSTTDEKKPERTFAAGAQEEIHPLASGNVTGLVAGLGCAVPLLALMMLGFGMMTQIMPFFAGLPLFPLIALVGSGIISLSVMIGIMISIIQARAGKKLFFLVNILIGTVFGAGFGAGDSIISSLVKGTGLNVPQIINSAAAMGAFAFMLSILVVIARRITVNEKGETFSADLSGLHKAGLAVSLIIVLFAVYETGTIIGTMERSVKKTSEKYGEMLSPVGLQVVNAHGYFEPTTGDLVISGSIQNTTDKPKTGWYLVTEVRDAKEAVLATVNMMNGIQLYTDKEREILMKRGAKADDLQKMFAFREGMVTARGSVNFEVRVMDPPVGSAGFLPTLRAFDPAARGEGLKDGMERH